MGLALITAPTLEPITTANVKDHLEITTSAHDTKIAAMLTAARKYVERVTSLQIMSATWDYSLDAFPDEDIELPHAPIASITHVKYYDDDGTLTTLSTDVYELDAASYRCRVVLEPEQSWPSSQAGKANAVVVRYVAGVATQAEVDGDVRNLLLLMVGELFERREEGITGTIYTPTGVFERMLAPLRRRFVA